MEKEKQEESQKTESTVHPIADQDFEESKPLTTPAVFKCEYCPMEFRSGKARGGHKRIHSKEKKELIKKKKNGKNRFSKADNNASSSSGFGGNIVKREPITICPVCNIEFASEKAMSGHLKVHKDRNWRGILPPTGRPNPNHRTSPDPNPSSNSSPSLGGVVQVVQLTLITRRALVNSGSGMDRRDMLTKNRGDGEEGKYGEIGECAKILMSLGQGFDGPLGVARHPEEDFEARDGIQEGTGNIVRDDSRASNSSKQARQEKSEEVEEERIKKRRNIGLGLGLGSSGAGEGRDTISSGKTRTGDYYCRLCDKSFSSHQAYGGHLSSHKKAKKRAAPSRQLETLESNGVDRAKKVPARSDGPRYVHDFDLNEPAPEIDGQ